MQEYIQEKLESAVRRMGTSGWDRAIATSATAASVAAAIARTPRDQRDTIDRMRVSTAQVRQLYAKLAEGNLAARRKLPGIGPKRAEIIVPGVAVLLAFLEEFHLSGVYYSRAGVRDGIIADLAARNVGAELSRLTRDQRHEVGEHVPAIRAYRSAARAKWRTFRTCCSPRCIRCTAWSPRPASSWKPRRTCTTWGITSAACPHKHSYYVVLHSDMPGFTERERLLIAALCRYHRKSLPTPVHSLFQALTADEKRVLMAAIPILRLADNLDRSHGKGVESPGVQAARRRSRADRPLKGDIDWSSGAPNARATRSSRFTTVS